MARQKETLRVTKAEVAEAFTSQWAEAFPPLLTPNQAAQLLQISRSTLYAWRSQGRLVGCCQRVGKHIRFLRDRLYLHVVNKGI